MLIYCGPKVAIGVGGPVSVFGKWSSKVWCLLGLLGVVACMDEYGIADLEEQSEANEKGTALSAALSKSGEAGVTVRFVAFGDVDKDDDIPFDMVPDVRIAAIKKDDVSDWWATVTGDGFAASKDSSVSYVPPGVQVVSSFERISGAPALFVTTGSGGTIETTLAFSHPAELGYMFCVISPTDKDLLAGCSSLGNIWDDINLDDDDNFNVTLYTYLSDGRAYIDSDSGRYQRFLDGTLISGEGSDAATVTFVSISYADIEPPMFNRNSLVAVIKDGDIGDWWKKISNNGEHPLFLYTGYYEWGIDIDSEILGPPARIVTTGYDAIAEVELEPGDYLFCGVGGTVSDCDYEYIAASQNYEYTIFSSELGAGIAKERTGYIERLLKEAKEWEFQD